jgi:hypothetical protein
MLDVSRSAEARQISRLSALWTSNCFAPITANIDKFHQQLSMDEITLIETLARDDMARYGYAPLTAANARIETHTQEAARMRSESGRQAAWHALETDNYRDFVLRRHRADFLGSVRERLMLQAMTATAVKPTAPHRLEALADPAAFEVTD